MGHQDVERSVWGRNMRAVVTRDGRLDVVDVEDPTPGSGHVLVRPLSTGICGSDLHALADFSNFAGLLDRVGAPSLDASADTVFGHEFCAEILEHGPDTAGTLPVGTRVCSVPIIIGEGGVERSDIQTGTQARWLNVWSFKKLSCCRSPTRSRQTSPPSPSRWQSESTRSAWPTSGPISRALSSGAVRWVWRLSPR